MIPALTNLTHEHANQIAEAVQAGPPDWEVDVLDDYNGYLSVLVSMQHELEAQPSYLIAGTVQQIELSEVQGDILRELGPFDTLQQASDALLVLLSPKPVS